MSKKRPVSEDDAALFRSAVGDVRVIDDERTLAHRRGATPRARADSPNTEPQPEPGGPIDSSVSADRDPGQLFVRPGLQHKHVRRLRQGRIAVEAETDLHGMRTREAQALLTAFLDECRDQGLRCVRVIHGKGRGSRGGHAVLKWEVDRWLRRHEAVMAFCSAQPRHGGTGALYVLLKS